MAYERDDTRQGLRDERGRWSEDRDRPRSRSREEDRSFFERAGEEISSWFGSDRDDRDRNYRDREQDRSSGWREVGRDEQRRQTGDFDRGRGDRDYRPMTGDYGRNEPAFGGQRDEDRMRPRGRAESNWDRDDYRRTEFAASRDRSQHPDPHYREWRQRQISEIDRDYDEYRREHQQKFESEFGTWRERRQAKRQMLSQIREQMEVVGSDDQHVGTIDKVAGDRIILTKSDPDSGGVHHSISCHYVDRVEGERVVLEWTADEARRKWIDENRNRALFEDENRGDMGAHMLDRSFSGTYRE